MEWFRDGALVAAAVALYKGATTAFDWWSAKRREQREAEANAAGSALDLRERSLEVDSKEAEEEISMLQRVKNLAAELAAAEVRINAEVQKCKDDCEAEIQKLNARITELGG